MKNVAVIGAGNWGKNLVRVFDELGVLRAVCDTRPEVEERLRAPHHDFEFHTQPEAVFADPGTLAVAIATPAATHFDLASKALAAGKDVYV